MKNMITSLKSKDGSSMILALVVLTVCILLGGIVVGASWANYNRIDRVQEERQCLLAAESAALFLKQDIGNNRQVFNIKVHDDGAGNYSYTTEDYVPVNVEDSTNLFDIMKKDAFAYVKEEAGVEAEEHLVITLGEEFEDYFKGTIDVDYKMERDYSVHCTVNVVSNDGKVSSVLQVDIPAVVQNNKTSLSIKWGTANIYRVGTVSEEETGGGV